METRILSDLALHGALIMAKDETGFPADPALGTMVLKESCLYAYINVGGLATWYPFSSKTRSYIHTQGLESSSWVINHNLGSTDLWYQVQDATGTFIMPSGRVTVDSNTININFSYATTGTVLIVAPDTVDVPVVKSSLIEVGGGAVIIDSTGVQINGSYVTTTASAELPLTAIDAEITRATAAEASISASLASYQPLDADLTAIAALSGTSGTLKKTAANTWELDTAIKASPYDVAGQIVGKPDNGATVLRFVANRAFTFPAGLSGSVAKAATAATASTVLTLYKNGVSFGTITFASSGTSGTFAAASQSSFVSGDVLTVVNQATADATLADVGFTLGATLV